jgi:uncharacterized integral membrane protein
VVLVVRVLNTVVAVVVALAVVLFAVSNRADVDITLWPLPYQVTVGTYAVVLLAVLVGFIAGLIAAWMAGGAGRRERRQLRKDMRELEKAAKARSPSP